MPLSWMLRVRVCGMRQVSKLELSPQLTTPNEERKVEEDALVHVTPDNALHYRRVGIQDQNVRSSMTLKYPQLQRIQSDNLEFVYIHVISASFSSRSLRICLIYKVR